MGWDGCSVDDPAQLYSTVLTQLADDFAPIKKVTRRPRQLDPWFDAECRSAKRLTRQLDRAAAVAGRRHDNATTVAAATEAWRAQRRVYRDLHRQKREAFWQSTVDAEKSNPRRLWQSVDTLLGRGRSTANDNITPSAFRITSRTKSRLCARRQSLRQCQTPFLALLVSWRKFDPVECDQVVEANRKLPNKSCAADPVPTSVLKQLADDVTPFFDLCKDGDKASCRICGPKLSLSYRQPTSSGDTKRPRETVNWAGVQCPVIS